MDVESTDKLKLDLRLIRRRGWISQADLERALEALPDVASKATRPKPAGSEGDAGSGSAAEAPPAGGGA